MTFRSTLNKIYYKSDFYVLFHIVQITMGIVLISYLVGENAEENSHRPFAVVLEGLIMLFMALDIIIFYVVFGFTIDTFSIVEAVILFLFVVLFIILSAGRESLVETKMELFLILARLVIQIVRFIISFHRLGQIDYMNKKKEQDGIEQNLYNRNRSSQEEAIKRNLEIIDL